MIDFFCEDIQFDNVDENLITNWINEVITKEKKIVGNITYIFCSDAYLLNINQQYLKHDYFTDVITFDYSENEFISGDIFISIDTVNDNSKDLNINLNDELYRVMVHGVLHLCGYNDKTIEEKIIMTNKENFYLNRLRG